ncbi:MAG: cell filamentation protein Fic, partial [Lewinella sp.]
MDTASQIIRLLQERSDLTSSEIHAGIVTDSGAKTTKRAIDKLVAKRLVDKTGTTRNTRYSLGRSYSILHSIDADAYLDKDVDDRQINDSFNFDLIRKDLYEVDLFTAP